ncbi:MAG: lamin tail domain-containing protein [Chlorobiota bacterium]|nr:lamin tail domain-containing protein [Chlorobiota bacterium]QQS67425.1 MAG: lamin tail domain-containing protein [Chlorobiota bacterium]
MKTISRKTYSNFLIIFFTFYVITNLKASSQILINEIMFDPIYVDGKATAEYVELLNNSDESVLISDFIIKDGTNKIVAQITKKDLTISPKSYFIIASDTSIYKKFPMLKDSNNLYFNKSSSLGLNSEFDNVVLINSDGKTIDSLQYKSSWHRKDLISTKGISLERISSLNETNLVSNWTSSSSLFGGTPSKINSVSSSQEISDQLFTVYPQTFSPDGDGHEDLLRITYNLPNGNYRIMIKAYDKHGNLVNTIANNFISSSKGEFSWDGLNSYSIALQSGAYLIRFEYYNDNGRGSNAQMQTVILAKKY